MTRQKLIWIFLGIITLLLRQLAAANPNMVEKFYSRGLFLGIRWSIDYLLGWMPFPLIYLFFTAVLAYLIYGIVGLRRSTLPLRQKLVNSLFSVLSFLGGLIFFFFFLWGFNYSRVSIAQQLNLNLKPLTEKELREELVWASEKVVKLREELSLYYSQNPYELELPRHTEKHLRQELEDWLERHNFPTIGRVRGRWLYPKGIFLHFSSAGLYFPFIGEGHIDAGLHVLDQPSTMAHELAHGYGFADEGTCNFLSFVACADSEEPFFAYSAFLNHWITLAANYRRLRPDDYQEIRDMLTETNRKDIEAMFAYLRKYPDIMPKFRYYAYDAYLKSQGIKEGMLNYNRVIMMVRAWRMAKRS